MLLSGTAVFFYIFWRFDPVKDKLYPGCWFYGLTGKLCPGCGGLRGTHSFLNGELLLALAYNPLLALIIPVTIYFVVFNVIALITGNYPSNLLKNKLFIYFLIFIIIIFWVVRNFNWFRPEFPGNY
ncbi:hypothetical protein BH10BAC5_BH10BAC5_13120 [soil metagenome]